jgi:hypothetical protein
MPTTLSTANGLSALTGAIGGHPKQHSLPKQALRRRKRDPSLQANAGRFRQK